MRDASIVIVVPVVRPPGDTVRGTWRIGPSLFRWPRAGPRAIISDAATRALYLNEPLANVVGKTRFHRDIATRLELTGGFECDVIALELISHDLLGDDVDLLLIHGFPLVGSASDLVELVNVLINFNIRHGAEARKVVRQLSGLEVPTWVRRGLVLAAWDTDHNSWTQVESELRDLASLEKYPSHEEDAQRSVIRLSTDWVAEVNRFGLFISRVGSRRGDEAVGRDFRIHGTWSDMFAAAALQICAVDRLEKVVEGVVGQGSRVRQLERALRTLNEVEALIRAVSLTSQGGYDYVLQRLSRSWELAPRVDRARQRVTSAVDMARVIVSRSLLWISLTFTITSTSTGLAVAVWLQRDPRTTRELVEVWTAWSVSLTLAGLVLYLIVRKAAERFG